MATGTLKKGIVIGSPALSEGTLAAAHSNGIGVTGAPAEIADDHIDEMKRLATTTWWQDAPHTKNAV